MRRAIDILVAAAALAVAFPVMIAIAALVALHLGRPIFFVQTRCGLGARRFRLFKFRTMSAARDPAGCLLPDRERLSPLGRLLRASRLDELPQLINMLAGDMSLIGPRPLLPGTLAAAGPAGLKRGAIRPGLTGWAQVNGNSLLCDEDKLALDAWYVAHRSPRLDLVILARTLFVPLRGERRDHEAIRRAHAGVDSRCG